MNFQQVKQAHYILNAEYYLSTAMTKWVFGR